MKREMTREEAYRLAMRACEETWNEKICKQIKEALEQEPKTGRCKDCKYFKYNEVTRVDGIPLIMAHEICSRWSDGCKTKEDGYCFLFEPQESEEMTREEIAALLARESEEQE